jgi:1-acyl-sn-glycerol-3-phosphate acyltransferase
MKKDWRGLEHVPREGGVILAVNHISHADPIAVADFVVYGTGRIARFLAKSTLFQRPPLVSHVMRGAGQIPVHRHTADASLALRDAVAALHNGECVAIYPEGTVSRDPEKWPMLAKTGVARLALLSGVPVIPVAQWGAEKILDSYRTKGLHLLPRHTMHIVAGPPVDLSAYVGKELTAEVLRAATDDIMWAVTALVAELRGEPAPTTFFDARDIMAKSRAARSAERKSA